MTTGSGREFDSSSFEHDGLNLQFLTWGEHDGQAIVFLHGGGLSGHTWKRTIRELGRELFCVAPDLRGHGDSDWHPDGDYELARHASDVRALIAHLEIDQCVLVGMSLGGAIALTIAPSADRELAGLVLIDTGPGGTRAEGRRSLDELMEGGRVFSSLAEAVDAVVELRPGRRREGLERSLAHNMRQNEAGNWVWKWDPLVRWRNRPMSEVEMERHAQERHRQLWKAASMVSCPTLIIRGEKSDMFLEADADDAVAGFNSARAVAVPSAGHFVQTDNPRSLARALIEFFEDDLALTLRRRRHP